MKLKIKSSFNENIILILLFLFGIGLFNYTGYILSLIIIFFFAARIGKKVVLDRTFFLLVFYSIFYFYNYANYWPIGSKEVITYLIAPWACYMLGVNLTVNSKDPRMLDKVIHILAFAFFLHGVLNFYVYTQVYGVESIMNASVRIAFDYWRNEMISVTTCSLYYVPLISLAVGYLFYTKNKSQKVFAFAVICVGMVMNITYANRTIFYLLLLLIVIKIGFVLREGKLKMRTVGVLFVGICIFYYMFTVDMFGIQTYIFNLDVFQRLTGNDVGRIEIWLDFLRSDWWKYPLGGKQADFSFGFVHNLWLDVLYTVGMLPFLLFIGFTMKAFSIVKKFYVGNPGRKAYMILILGMTISCGVEPVMDANPYYFLILVMMLGAMEGKNKIR